MAAVTRIAYISGASATFPAVSAETGMAFNREETLAGTTNAVPRPTSTGTEFSWPKVICLEVTTGDTTSISNRRVRAGAAPPAGLKLYFRDDGGTYTRATAVAASASGTNDSTPAGYSALTTSDQQYDNTSVTANAGRNGDYLSLALGVSNLYAGGAGNAIGLATIYLTYDEQ